MNKEYQFNYEKNKSILEQNLMPETKSMIIQVYKKYLCPENEKSAWEKYDKLCFEKEEKKKVQKYNPDDIFKNNTKEEIIEKQSNQTNKLIEYKEETFVIKIINKLKMFLSNLIKK